jgi:hypothetical protein
MPNRSDPCHTGVDQSEAKVATAGGIEPVDSKVMLDSYSDLFDADLDALAVTLDSRYSPPRVAKCGHRGLLTVANSHETASTRVSR